MTHESPQVWFFSRKIENPSIVFHARACFDDHSSRYPVDLSQFFVFGGKHGAVKDFVIFARPRNTFGAGWVVKMGMGINDFILRIATQNSASAHHSGASEARAQECSAREIFVKHTPL